MFGRTIMAFLSTNCLVGSGYECKRNWCNQLRFLIENANEMVWEKWGGKRALNYLAFIPEETTPTPSSQSKSETSLSLIR